MTDSVATRATGDTARSRPGFFAQPCPLLWLAQQVPERDSFGKMQSEWTPGDYESRVGAARLLDRIQKVMPLLAARGAGRPR